MADDKPDGCVASKPPKVDEDEEEIMSCSQPATQPLENNTTFEEDDPPSSSDEMDETWGMLFPISFNLKVLKLVEPIIKVGRASDSQLVIDNDQVPKEFLDHISKRQFKIVRKEGGHTEIHDTSSNGTFLNGKKIGKSRINRLTHNDKIAMSNNKDCFIFMYTSPDCQKPNLCNELKRNYMVSSELGKGACGVVSLAFRKSDGKKFAIKSIEKKRVLQQGPLQNEAKLTMKANHPCIIKIFEVLESPTTVFYVMEFAPGGELFDKIVSSNHFSEPQARAYFYQLCKAVQYLHSINIAHRDLKPENILLSNHEDDVSLLKITDLGLSKETSQSDCKTFVGTPQYLAPEILIGKVRNKAYDHLCDMWSVGVILYVMLSGSSPFYSAPNHDILKQIVDCDYNFNGKVWEKVSNEAKDLVCKLLVSSPSRRLNATQALEHQWVTGDPDTIRMVDNLIRPIENASKKRALSEEELEITNENMAANSCPPCKRQK